MSTTTLDTHPHNASVATYDKAIAASLEISLNGQKIDNICTAMCFETIEATDARRDAVELFKAIQALRDAADAVYEAARLAKTNASIRAHYLANGSGL